MIVNDGDYATMSTMMVGQRITTRGVLNCLFKCYITTGGYTTVSTMLRTIAPSTREDATCQKEWLAGQERQSYGGRRIGYRQERATVSGMCKRESTIVSTGKCITNERS
ncbi:hypothetical protein Hypma_004071 [Hypsizygus marmoreus]|uniref:Uncharacterized protein n=1 Tax=Hypsizygus marmoreus TaxID=39966 RepID=A0A369J0P0_HYPMA|nr:hypothetical protein Hypma_004071 [Hypsizygus marmoreus]